MIKTNYVSLKKTFLVFILLTAIAAVASYYYAVEQHYLEQQNIHLNKMVKYHTKMIKTGSISSLVKLGQMYEKGEGVEKNLSKAQELFKKAINYNKYLDEIYPSYSDDYSNEENQLKSLQISVKSIEKSNKQPEIKLTSKNKIYSKSKKQTNKNNSVKVKFNNSKVIPREISKNKPKIILRKKHHKKIFTQSKITNSKNINFKKTVTIKKNSNTIEFKKPRLHAKRSPSLNEERADYEIDLGIINNETLIDNINAKILSIKKNAEKKNSKKNTSEKKQSLKSSFASNPCDTESAQYIAKCRRLK